MNVLDGEKTMDKPDKLIAGGCLAVCAGVALFLYALYSGAKLEPPFGWQEYGTAVVIVSGFATALLGFYLDSKK